MGGLEGWVAWLASVLAGFAAAVLCRPASSSTPPLAPFLPLAPGPCLPPDRAHPAVHPHPAAAGDVWRDGQDGEDCLHPGASAAVPGQEGLCARTGVWLVVAEKSGCGHLGMVCLRVGLRAALPRASAKYTNAALAHTCIYTPPPCPSLPACLAPPCPACAAPPRPARRSCPKRSAPRPSPPRWAPRRGRTRERLASRAQPLRTRRRWVGAVSLCLV